MGVETFLHPLPSALQFEDIFLANTCFVYLFIDSQSSEYVEHRADKQIPLSQGELSGHLLCIIAVRDLCLP